MYNGQDILENEVRQHITLLSWSFAARVYEIFVFLTEGVCLNRVAFFHALGFQSKVALVGRRSGQGPRDWL